MDTFKNIFLTIGCVAFAFVVALCVLMCVPSTRTGIYRMLNVASIGEQTQMADEKTELYIQTQTYRVQLESLNQEKSRIEAQLERLQENYDEGVAMLAEYQATITNLNQELADANNDNNNLQNQIVGLNVSIQNLNNQIDGYVSQIDGLNNDLNDLNVQYDSLYSQLEFIRTQKEDLINQNTILSNEVSRLNNDIMSLNDEIVYLQEENNRQLNQIQMLGQMVNNYSLQLNDLYAEVQGLRQLVDDNFQIDITNVGAFKSFDYGVYDGNNLLYSSGEQETFETSYFAGSTIINQLEYWKEIPENIRKSVQNGLNPTMGYGEYIKITAGTHQTYYNINQTNYRFTENTDVQFRVFYNGNMIDVNMIDDYLDEVNYSFEIYFEHGNDAEFNLTNFYINYFITDYSVI